MAVKTSFCGNKKKYLLSTPEVKTVEFLAPAVMSEIKKKQKALFTYISNKKIVD